MLERKYTISTNQKKFLESQITDLNRFTRTLGIPLIDGIFLPPDNPTKDTPPLYTETLLRRREVDLGGWHLYARMDHTPSAPRIYYEPFWLLEVEVPEEYRTIQSNYCDHCQTRRDRHDTYVLYHPENDKFIRVGKRCLSQVVGAISADRIVVMGQIAARYEQIMEDFT